MSTPYKPLSEQIAGKMITDLKNGTSVFQRPNNNVNGALPFNLESGYKYTGPSALVLLMQKRDDPRWATSNQANRNHTAVMKGSTGTLINFMSNYDIKKVVDNEGNPILKENGKQRTERVKLDEPKQVEAWLFNGEQLRKMPKWEKEPAMLSGIERVEAMLKNSKAELQHGGELMRFDKDAGRIILPEKEQFGSPEKYAAEALHQLVHREIGNVLEDQGIIKEELRANLASLFLSKELNLPYELNYHDGYVNSWSQVLKEEPGELFKAASDAQLIVNNVLSFEMAIEKKSEAGQDKNITGEMQQQPDETKALKTDGPDINPERLKKGEIIPHNGTEFKVLAELKNNVYNMQDMGDNRKFKMGSDSGLFAALIEARNNPVELGTSRESDQQESRAFDEEQEETNYQMQR